MATQSAVLAVLALFLFSALSAPWGVASAAPSDSSRRFPLRRESGGTRSVCVSRLLAHLVPVNGLLDPGSAGLIALIEGESPQPSGLVLQLAGRAPWVLPPRPAGIRLLTLPPSFPPGLWESFPACNASAEPEAPPARSELVHRGDPDNRRLQLALLDLRRHCGGVVPRDGLLPVFGYEHLREQLPPELPVSCDSYPAAASSQISS